MIDHDHTTIAELAAWAREHDHIRCESTAPADGHPEITVAIHPRAEIHTAVPVVNGWSVDHGPRVRAWAGEYYEHLHTREWADPADYETVAAELVERVRMSQHAAQPASVQALAAAHQRRVRLEQDAREALEMEHEAIRTALADGVVPAVITAHTGYSAGRISQIRHRTNR